MKTIYIIFLLLFGAIPLFAERIIKNNLKSIYGFMFYSERIIIGHGIEFYANLGVSRNGTGILEIANLNLYIYDSCHDGEYYKNDLLDIEFVDINSDGYKDIVVSGVIFYTNKNITTKRKQVVYIYMFVPEKKEFHLSYKNNLLNINNRKVLSYNEIFKQAIKVSKEKAYYDIQKIANEKQQ